MYGQKFGRKLGKASQNREKQEWAKERPKLDNARKLRGIFSMRMTKRIQKQSKTQEENWKDLTTPEMSCKRDKQHSSIGETRVEQKHGQEKEFKTMYGCIEESHESTRQRAESLQSKKYEDRIAGKGFTWCINLSRCHPQAMKILDANGKKAQDNSGMGFLKCQEQKGGHHESAKRQNESPLCFFDGQTLPHTM